MATIEIRDILDENGKTIFPRTHVDAVIGMKDFSFFELVEDTTTTPHTYSVKLKDSIDGHPLAGLWTLGFMSAGGIGSGGGGGGGVSYLNDLSDVSVPNPAAGDLLSWDATANSGQGAWVNVPRSQVGTPVSLSNGADYSSLTVNSVTADFYTKSQVDSLVSSLDVNVLSDITTTQDGILTFEWSNGDTINVDLNHEHSDYVPLTRTINGIDLSQNRNFYVGKTAIQGTSQSQALEGILSVKETSASSLFEWEPNAGGTGVGAWRFHGNLYADGWIAAGGIGSGGGGGGGGVSSFYDLPEIGISSSSTILSGQVLTYNGTAWVNQNIGVSVSNTIADGTTGYTRIATITINGTSVNINAPADGGGGGVGTEVDPVFTNSAAYGITTSDITAWNGKLSGVMMNGSAITPTNGVVNLGTVLTAVPDISATYVTVAGTQTVSGVKTFSSKLTVNAAIAVNGIDTIEQDTTNHIARLNYGGRSSVALNAYGTSVSLRAYNSSTEANLLSVQTDKIVVGSQLLPNNMTGLNLGGSSTNQRWSTVYGLNANLSGGLTFMNTENTASTGLLTFPAGYMVLRTGANIANSYKQLTFHETFGFYPETSGVNLGYNGANYRWATIYGVNENLTGDIVMSSTSHIDLGPVRIEYDSVSDAVHITTNDSTNHPTISLYADGFVAAGGVQASE